MKIWRLLIWALVFSAVSPLLCIKAAAQTEIPKLQVLTGFSYLNTAKNNTNQRGFESSAGYNLNKWLTLGLDFTHYSGSGSKQITGLPVPLAFDAETYTVAIGPQFSLRRSKWIVPFVRPGVGLVHETATPHPIVGLPPLPQESEWRAFYGAGGGIEVHHIVPHAAIVVLSDYLRSRLFGQDLNSYRLSAGLVFLLGNKQVTAAH